MYQLLLTTKNNSYLQTFMRNHYSMPKGFVGRQIFYLVKINETVVGAIGWGSVTRHLPNRPILGNLLHGMSNIFYHIEKPVLGYPSRNFTTKILLLSEQLACVEYSKKYTQKILWVESLVELPRTGALYKKAKYTHVGTTVGYTCKRTSGLSSDTWSGKRVWDTKNLRPKLVFYKALKINC